jgi:hypothetical protein
MNERHGNPEVLRSPAALALSAAAFALIALVAITRIGVSRDGDEGAPARLFQLLLLLQVPFSAWFALTWVPRRPWPAVAVLALHVLLAVAAVLTVVALESRAAL